MTLLAAAGIGLVIGFLGGMFGKGGSAIATPMMAAVGVPAIIAVAARSRPRFRPPWQRARCTGRLA